MKFSKKLNNIEDSPFIILLNLIKNFQMYSSHVSLECNVVKCTITSQLMAPAHCLPSFLLQTYIVTRRWNVRTAPLQLCNIRILRHRQQGQQGSHYSLTASLSPSDDIILIIFVSTKYHHYNNTLFQNSKGCFQSLFHQKYI